MKFNRLILSLESSKKLSLLKGRTGLTPNILCRFGLVLSLNDLSLPDPTMYKQDGLELMRHVLLGELDTVLIALFKQRAYKDGLDLKNNKVLVDYFRAHINRGAELLYNRVKNLEDIKNML